MSYSFCPSVFSALVVFFMRSRTSTTVPKSPESSSYTTVLMTGLCISAIAAPSWLFAADYYKYCYYATLIWSFWGCSLSFWASYNILLLSWYWFWRELMGVRSLERDWWSDLSGSYCKVWAPYSQQADAPPRNVLDMLKFEASNIHIVL